jgi:alginate O-acetyltransferase complex protein AlgI
MVFSSIAFLLYFLPAFLTVYILADKKYKNGVILVSSILFYAWGGPKFIFVILGTTMVDFFIVRRMYYAKSQVTRKVLLILSLFINVGLLFYFKYINFFIDNINTVLSSMDCRELPWLRIVMPIGISFYTFETVTYVMDVYRRVHKPLDNFWHYQLYIILFPKLIAGPIVRYHEIADQITGRFSYENNENRLAGMYRFIIGLSKKVIIANPMGAYADQVMNPNFMEIDTPIAWLGILAYTLQIYFDFSGYSDMAIGLCKFMGFRIPENFNNPYISQSITEFWRRWHITLGNWMKNYLYIPLGGNRVDSKWRLYFNLWLVFIASGFWHGASWNFIIWGAFHGLFLILDRAFLLKATSYINRYFRMAFTFIAVMTGWVFFRIESLEEAINYLEHMYSFRWSDVPIPEKHVVMPMIAGIFF